MLSSRSSLLPNESNCDGVDDSLLSKSAAIVTS
jgi:hypothetical protein